MRQKQDVFLSVFAVALLAEGVDRNFLPVPPPAFPPSVALLAEGVDRNKHDADRLQTALKSPSSRRAWIEILLMG